MTLAELSVLLKMDTGEFEEGAREAEKKAESLAKSFEEKTVAAEAWGTAIGTAVGNAIGAVIGGAVDLAVDFLSSSVTVAKEMEQIEKSVDSVFGSSSGNIDRWADNSVRLMGLSEKAAKEYAVSFGEIFKSAGTNQYKAYEMSTAITQLTADLAALHSVDTEKISEKLQKALIGKYDSIRDILPTMSDDSIAEHFGMSPKEFKALGDAEKIFKRYEFIMASTSDAQGEFAERNGTFEASITQMQANLDNLQESIGSSLLPVLNQLLEIMNGIFSTPAGDSATESVTSLKDAYIKEVAAIGDTAAKALSLVEALELLSETSQSAETSGAWQAIFSELQSTIPGLGALIEDQTGKITGGTTALKEYIQNWKELALEQARQKAVQSRLDRLSSLIAERSELVYEQMIANQLEQSSSESKRSFEQMYTERIQAGIQAMVNNGLVDEEALEGYLQASEDLGASEIFTALRMGASLDQVMNWSDLGSGVIGPATLYKLWTYGGGTIDELKLLYGSWLEATETNEKYSGVDNTAEVKEKDKQIQEAQQEYDALDASIRKVYGDFAESTSEETPSQGAEQTEAETSAQEAATVAQETATAAQETAAEVAAAAEEAATAAQQVTETAAQMTADANSTDAMLITVLQGLPGNIATAVGGMSVTLDGDTIVGYVSAAMAREARGSQNTGG